MEDLLTIRQVSIILKVHQLTIRRYIKEGRLKAVKMAGNIRINRVAIEAFTREISPEDYSQKPTPRIEREAKVFSLNDPIFRLKGRGMSLKALEFKT